VQTEGRRLIMGSGAAELFSRALREMWLATVQDFGGRRYVGSLLPVSIVDKYFM